MKKHYRFLSVALAACLTLGVAAAAGCSGGDDVPEAESAIVEVTALGFMDYDGAKLQGIAVEYDRDLTGANVAADTYTLDILVDIACDEVGSGNIGDVTAVYVNDKAEVSENGGTGSGKYVVIELFCDYLATSTLNYKKTMSVRVKQSKDITLGDGTVIPAYNKYVSNTLANSNNCYNFYIPEIEGFQYYTNLASDYGADGAAFHAENCFNTQDGTYSDVDLAYALYLPEDYNENGSYAMVTLQNPAAAAGTHPMESVLAYRSASMYASDWAQSLVKEQHGVDGLIVVVPVVTARVNDNGGTPAEYEAVVRLWDYVIETYHVDTDYIYGSGQSVGGMIVLETNRIRDNFFAGILLYDNQWAQNYYIDTIFSRGMVKDSAIAASAEMHYPRVDENLIWDYSLDTKGNKVYDGHDPYNYYYLVSDDNITVMNLESNNLSNDSWREMKYLYNDLVGADITRTVIDASQAIDTQNEQLDAWLSRTDGDDMKNINWISFTSGDCGRRLDASYEWLLSQTRQSEIAREKLDLNKPFVLADEQDQSEDRLVNFTDGEGNAIYYLTGKAGAGTQGYNSSWLNTYTIADAAPGWLPEGMSWQNGVTIGHILSVEAIGDSAVAVEYDADMTGLFVNLKGDRVYNYLTDEYREDDFIVLDPFEFYDADGNKIECTVTTVYVNDAAQTVAGAERLSGSGCYLILELDASIDWSNVSKVIQRLTVRTDDLFAEAGIFRIEN